MKPQIGYVVLWGCILLFGPERFPIDEITHVEIRFRLCTTAMEPHVNVDTRTYQRVMTPGGPRYSQPPSTAEYDKPQDAWWITRNQRLYITTTPIPDETTPSVY